MVQDGNVLLAVCLSDIWFNKYECKYTQNVLYWQVMGRV
jgi:hypothetical protein